MQPVPSGAGCSIFLGMIDLERARQFLKVRHDGILTTIKHDGRPQLSNVLYFLDDDSRVKISVTQTRAKTHSLRRDPRASLHGQGRDRYEYLVAEGTVEFIEGDGVAEALRHYYRKVRGEHPDWAEYDAAMAADRRLLLAMTVERAYGPLR